MARPRCHATAPRGRRPMFSGEMRATSGSLFPQIPFELMAGMLPECPQRPGSSQKSQGPPSSLDSAFLGAPHLEFRNMEAKKAM